MIARSFNVHLYLFLLFNFGLIIGTNALVEVLSPAKIAGIYQDAPVRVFPKSFDVTAELVLPSSRICVDTIPESDNFTDKIRKRFAPRAFARKLLRHDVDTAGQIIACTGRSCSVLGYLYSEDKDYDEGVQLPSLNFNDEGKILEYLRSKDREKVIVRIADTSYNPWLSLGNGPAGVFLRAFFEIYAIICLITASAKLYVFIKFQGFKVNITQFCLWMEIFVALLRILFMIGPLSFGTQFLPIEVTQWLNDTPNVLSLITTLLITFYWQEILTLMSERLSNNLVNNLSKFRLPFLIISIIIISLHMFATLNTILYFLTDVSGSTYTITAIISLVISFAISIFFFVIGYRVFKVSGPKSYDKKATRVSIFIVSSAVAMMLRILALIFYVSPVAASGRSVYFFTWWLIFLSSWTISFTKILAFEPPPTASKSFGSYFRRPTRFFKYIMNRFFGFHMTTESNKITEEMNSAASESAVYSNEEDTNSDVA